MEKIGPPPVILHPRILARITEAARQQGLKGDIELDVNSGTSAGDNYLGVIYNVRALGRDTAGGQREARFVLKTMHPDETARSQLQSADLFATEIKFYSRVFPAYRNFVRSRWRGAGDWEDLLAFVPRCFAAETAECDGDFILMEDLKASGFRMGDRMEGMDQGESLMVLRAMGRMHALSLAMREAHPEVIRELSEGMVHPFFVSEKREMYRDKFQMMANTSLEVVRTRSPESAKHLGRWLARGFVDAMVEVCQMREPLSVINHGDIWTNNVLFRGSPAKEVMLLDYQMTMYHSPAIDLLYTIYTSVRKPLRDEIYEDLLAEYLDALGSTLRYLGFRDDILTMETLKEHLRKYAMYGLGLCILLIPMIFGRFTNETVTVADGDAITNMSKNHGVYMKDEKIQTMVTEIVDEFVRRGYFKD